MLKGYIHHDQVGFNPGMQGWFNMEKSSIVVHHINRMKGEKITRSFHLMHKNYDKIQHSFMIKIAN